MDKVYTGHCVAQGCEYSVTVSYLPDGIGNYIKGVTECKYYGLHQPEACKNCTILSQIPDQL